MVILFSSLGDDPQTLALADELNRKSIQTMILDTHRLSEYKLGIDMEYENSLYVNNVRHLISGIIYTTHPRIDAIIDYPKDVEYPMEWRIRNQSFLKELSDFLVDVPVFPGNLHKIETGESKLRILKLAKKAGLIIPAENYMGFQKKESKRKFSKAVGFPFIVTNKIRSSKEVCVTHFSAIDDSKKFTFSSYPVFLQTPIKASVHIRCVASQEKVFSVARRVPSSEIYKDFRELNENENFLPEWISYNLEKDIQDSIGKLLKSLDLKWATPEFLVDQQNRHVFIDLNPCGDWFDFFKIENTQQEITTHLSEIVCGNL